MLICFELRYMPLRYDELQNFDPLLLTVEQNHRHLIYEAFYNCGSLNFDKR